MIKMTLSPHDLKGALNTISSVMAIMDQHEEPTASLQIGKDKIRLFGERGGAFASVIVPAKIESGDGPTETITFRVNNLKEVGLSGESCELSLDKKGILSFSNGSYSGNMSGLVTNWKAAGPPKVDRKVIAKFDADDVHRLVQRVGYSLDTKGLVIRLQTQEGVIEGLVMDKMRAARVPVEAEKVAAGVDLTLTLDLLRTLLALVGGQHVTLSMRNDGSKLLHAASEKVQVELPTHNISIREEVFNDTLARCGKELPCFALTKVVAKEWTSAIARTQGGSRAIGMGDRLDAPITVEVAAKNPKKANIHCRTSVGELSFEVEHAPVKSPPKDLSYPVSGRMLAESLAMADAAAEGDPVEVGFYRKMVVLKGKNATYIMPAL